MLLDQPNDGSISSSGAGSIVCEFSKTSLTLSSILLASSNRDESGMSIPVRSDIDSIAKAAARASGYIGLQSDSIAAVSYTHLTLPTNREV